MYRYDIILTFEKALMLKTLSFQIKYTDRGRYSPQWVCLYEDDGVTPISEQFNLNDFEESVWTQVLLQQFHLRLRYVYIIRFGMYVFNAMGIRNFSLKDAVY